MKFFHLADLHIGKTVNSFSMLEDQRHIFAQIIEHLRRERPDAVVIAGDVYDRALPGEKAVQLFDEFLSALHAEGVAVLAVAGNHDSGERLGWGSGILRASGVYIYGVFDGKTHVVTLGKGADAVNFHLLPFVRPAMVRRFYPQSSVESYHDAVALVLQNSNIQPEQTNVLIAHQFVVAGGMPPETSDSELRSVGGVEEVDSVAFAGFSYVALGHLHKPQRMGAENVRYAGSPLKYSFSERGHKKSLTMVRLQDGEVEITQLPLSAVHDMRQITGRIEEILDAQQNGGVAGREDYLRVVLTNENEVPGAMGKLRGSYPNVMELSYDNTRSRTESSFAGAPVLASKTPEQLFVEFFIEQNGKPPSAAQMQLVDTLLAGQNDVQEEQA